MEITYRSEYLFELEALDRVLHLRKPIRIERREKRRRRTVRV